MDQHMADVDVSIGPLWIRRQLFEHSVTIPLLTTSNASQIDFHGLAQQLLCASITKPPSSPVVTYHDWVVAAGLYARLDSSQHASIIIEALEINVPHAFLKCNNYNYQQQKQYHRNLLIPVPELLAFIKLHAAATVSNNFRHTADSVWPIDDLPNNININHLHHNTNISNHVNNTNSNAFSLSPGNNNISLTPASPKVIQPTTPNRQANSKPILDVNNESLSPNQQQHQTSPTNSQSQSSSPRQPSQSTSNATTSPILQQHSPIVSGAAAAVVNNNLESVVRKKSPNHVSPIMNSQSVIIASGQHALERETRLVINNLKALLLVIASTYGISIDDDQPNDNVGNKSNMDKGIAESGTLTPHPTSITTITTTTTTTTTATSSSTTSNSVSNDVKTKNCAKSKNGGGTILEDEKSTTTDVNKNNKISRGGVDAIMVDDNINNNVSSSNHSNENTKSSKNSLNKIEFTRQMFEHLSFLFTTSSKSDGSFRSMSTIVPQWNDIENTSTITLIELVDIITIAVTRVATQEITEGVIDVVDISDLEKKTVIRTSMPRTNQKCIDKKSKKDLVNRDGDIVKTETMNSKQENAGNDEESKGVEIKGVEEEKEKEKDKLVGKENENEKNDEIDEKKEYTPDVRIWNCSDSHIYLLCALGRVSFIGCRGCTLFIGGCVSLSLINCENVRVHAVSRVCRGTNCFDTHFYLCTNSAPKIVGENRGLVFAPYNAVYPRAELDKHLEIVGVDVTENVWDKFYQPAVKGSSVVDGEGSHKEEEIAQVVARKLSPEQFLPFAVPVKYREGTIIGDLPEEEEEEEDEDVEEDTTSSGGSDEKSNRGKWDSSLKCLFGVCVPIPGVYADELKSKKMQVVKIRKEIREIEKKWLVHRSGGGKDVSMMEDNDKIEKPKVKERDISGGVVHSIIQDRFRDWLTSSGRIRQISDLVRMAQES